VWVRDRGLPFCVGVGPTCAGATGGREAARRFLNTEGQVKAKEVYLHLAAVCERAAANALLPEAKAGMLASAAVWRRLAMESNNRRDDLAVLGDLDARSFSVSPILPVSGRKN
jgi:hypothetical protein